MIAGALTIELNANIARLAGELRQANDAVSGFARRTESALAGVRSAFATLGVGLSAGAFIALVKGSIDAAAKLDDLAEKTGAAVEELSKLEQVARIGGHSMEIAESALIKLSKALHGTDEESKGAGKALAALGLQADALKNKDTAEALRIVAGELNKYKDGAGKTALALDLLGKSGAQALPFLKDLATEQGIATRVTAEQAAAAEELQKSMGRLGNEMRGVTQAMALELVPFLSKLMEQMREATTIAGGFASGLALIMRTNALKDFGLDLKATREQLAGLEQDRARQLKSGPVDVRGLDLAIADAKKRVELLKLQQQQEALALGGTDTPGERARMGTGAKGALDYKATATAAAAAAEVEGPFAKMMNALLEEELKLKGELTTVDKLALDIGKMTLKQFEALSIKEQVELEFLAHNIDLLKQEKVALEAYTKAMEFDLEQQKEVDDFMTARADKVGAAILSASKQIEQMEFETALIGKTNVERETAIFLRQAEIDKIDEATVARGREAIASKNAADEAKRQVEINAAEMKRSEEEIGRGLTDALMRGFEGGKDAATNFIDTLKNMFKTLILRPIIQWVLSPISGAISATLAGLLPGAANASSAAGGGAGGLFNLASTGNSLYNALSGNTSSFLSSLFGASSANTASSLSAAAGLSGASALALGAGGLSLGGAGLGLSAAGVNAAALGAGTFGSGALGLSTAGVNAAALGTGAAGAGGAALSAIGTALPYIGIAIAAASMLGLFGGKKTAAVGTGYNFYGDYDPSGAGMLNLTSQGLTNVGPEPPIFRDPAGNHPATAYRTSVGGTVNELLRLAREIGLATDTLRPVSFSTGVSGVGQAAEDSSIPVVAGQIAEALAEQLIPGLKDMALENETLLATFVRLQQQVKLTDQIIEILGLNTGTAFRGVGAEAITLRNELITLMGGMQNAASLTESFYQNFFTDAERFAIDSRRVNTALHELGVTALPRTRAEFRLLVEVQDLNTRSGREMFAALMQLAPAFAAVTQVIDEAITNLNTLAGVRSAALTAIDEQIRASESAAQTARRAADSYRQLTASLADAIVQLRGGDLSPLLPGQKLAEARSQLGTVYGLATAGDAQALAKLPQVATDFLSASRDYNASSAAYTRDFADVMRMLEQAGKLSEHWNEYEVTLLDLQTNLLEAIRAELTSPTSDTAVISQQSALLSTIQVLLGQQTSVILTGNAVQDVIRNITALDTAYSAEALRAMITGDSLQATGIAQVVLLLQTLVMLTGQQLAADAAAEASRIVEAAAAAAAFAATAATVAITTAQTSAAAAIATAQGSAAGVIAGATPALTFETWLAGFNSITREDDRRFYAEGGTLSLSEMMALFTATGHAGGGIASGWSMVGEQGPELANFASPARIYTASETRAALSGGISDEKLDKLHAAMKEVGALLIEASKRSREDMKEQNGVIKDGLKENARDTGNRMADAVDARTLA